MPGWEIIYDTAAGNGPHHDTLGIGGFLPHGWALMKPSQNVETGHVSRIWVTSTCEIDPSGNLHYSSSTIFSRGSSCEKSVNSGDLQMIVLGYVGTQGFLFHRQKRPTKTKLWKPEENVKKFCTPYETTIPKYCMAAHWNALLDSAKA